MSDTMANDFHKAQRAREILESVIPSVFLVAYFGGAMVAVVLCSVFGVRENFQFFYVFMASALVVGILWWLAREIPKRKRAMNELKFLLPNVSIVSLIKPRHVFRFVEFFVKDERQKITALLKNRLRDLNVRQYSGLFLEGGRFEMYHGKPTDRAMAIKAEVELINRKFGLSLEPSFVQGQEICVHIPVLGSNIYFG